MDIRLNKPDAGLRQAIINAAKTGGCYANIKYKPNQNFYHCTFTLERFPHGPQAAFEIQDITIESLLSVYPDATIRTARAVFEGLDDFQAQKKARVA